MIWFCCHFKWESFFWWMTWRTGQLENPTKLWGLHGLPPVSWRMGVRRTSDAQLLGKTASWVERFPFQQCRHGLKVFKGTHRRLKGQRRCKLGHIRVDKLWARAMFTCFPIVIATYKMAFKPGRGRCPLQGESEPWLWEEGGQYKWERLLVPYRFLYANWCT